MKKLLIALIALPVLLVAAVAVFLATLDPNDYHAPLAKALSEQTGRRIDLKGAIGINLTSHGIMLEVTDVVIGNPAWASRPDMARIGRFEMGLALPPLLRSRVVVTGVTLTKVDALLESASGERRNWDMQPQKARNDSAGEASSGASSPARIAWQINQVAIKDSVFGMRDVTGKTTKAEITSMSVAPSNGGVMAKLEGRFQEAPVKATARTDRSDPFGTTMRPLALDIAYGGYELKAEGKISLNGKKAEFPSFSLRSGGSEIHGSLAAEWGGNVPKINATLESGRFAPSDFQTAESKSPQAAVNGQTPPPTPREPKRVFSDAPLGLGTLRQAEGNIDLSIDSLELGTVALSQVKSNIALRDGQLNLAPLTAIVGGGSLNGQVQVNAASSPTKLGATLFLKNIELAEMLKLGGAESLIEGKATVDLNLASSGDSARELAGNLSGTMSVTSAGEGTISRSQDPLMSGLAKLLAPETSANATMNCLVARFTASNGIVRDNGILIDTAAATIAGRGGMDLREETLDFMFRGKPKGINVGSLIPPVRIEGSLLSPKYGVHAESVIRNVAGLLGGNLAALNDPIPDVITQAGQNACLAALNAPKAQKPNPENGNTDAQDLKGKANKAVQELGGKLMKGLFGQ